MRKIIHKNQVVITTLVVLIAIAGYVSYDRKNGGPEETKTVANTDQDIVVDGADESDARTICQDGRSTFSRDSQSGR